MLWLKSTLHRARSPRFPAVHSRERSIQIPKGRTLPTHHHQHCHWEMPRRPSCGAAGAEAGQKRGAAPRLTEPAPPGHPWPSEGQADPSLPATVFATRTPPPGSPALSRAALAFLSFFFFFSFLTNGVDAGEVSSLSLSRLR